MYSAATSVKKKKYDHNIVLIYRLVYVFSCIFPPLRGIDVDN